MPRITLVLDGLSGAAALEEAERAAEEQGYTLSDGPRGELRVRKGNLTASVLLGAFVLYAHFDVYLGETKKGDLTLNLEWETPWWTGFIGVGRTRSAARRLADQISDGVEDVGGEVLHRRDS